MASLCCSEKQGVILWTDASEANLKGAEPSELGEVGEDDGQREGSRGRQEKEGRESSGTLDILPAPFW